MRCQHPLIVENVEKLHWHSEADTAAFAQKLALKPGLANATIELQGNLGAGKTTFARYLLQALGVTGRIKSPTYAIVESYSPYPAAPSMRPGFAIWHFDFYRFNDPQEWEEAGFREIFAGEGLKIVEWAEKAGVLQPTPDLVIALHSLDTGDADGKDGQNPAARQTTLTACTLVGKELLNDK